MIDTLIQDVKYAARSLRRTPGFATAAIVTLALGIGANATIFTLLDAVLFKRPSDGIEDRMIERFLQAATPHGRRPVAV